MKTEFSLAQLADPGIADSICPSCKRGVRLEERVRVAKRGVERVVDEDEVHAA